MGAGCNRLLSLPATVDGKLVQACLWRAAGELGTNLRNESPGHSRSNSVTRLKERHPPANPEEIGAGFFLIYLRGLWVPAEKRWER